MKKLILILSLLFINVSVLFAQDAPYSVVYGVSEKGQHRFYKATFTDSWSVELMPGPFLFGQFAADFVAPIWFQDKMYVVQPQSPDPENTIAVTLSVYDPQTNQLTPIMDVPDPSTGPYIGVKFSALSPDGQYALLTSTTNYYAPPYLVDLKAGEMLWRPECIASVVAWGTSDVVLFTSSENAEYTSYGGSTTCKPNLTRFDLQTGSVIKSYPTDASGFAALDAETQRFVDDDDSHPPTINEQQDETQTTYTRITWQDHKSSEQVLYSGPTPLVASIRPGGNVLAFIAPDGTLHVYTTQGLSWTRKDVTLPSIDFVDNTWMGDWLVLKDTNVFLLNTVTGEEVHNLPANTTISSVSPDGIWWLLASYQEGEDVNTLTAWNIKTGEEVVLAKGFLDQNNFHWSPRSYYAWSR